MTDPYFEDERITLYRGNALAVLASLPDASVDAIFADPPYSSGGLHIGTRSQDVRTKYTNQASTESEFSGDNRDSRAYGYWSALWLGEALRVTKRGGVCALFTDWRQLPTTSDALQAGGWVWRGVVPWVKPQSRPVLGRWLNQCEYLVWGTAGMRSYETIDGKVLPGFYMAAAPREREHAAQKPLDVLRDLMAIAPPDGVVLDPFMGSGTTGVAAVIEGRRFMGVEMTEHFCGVAERRIRDAALHPIERGEQATLGFGEAS